MRIPNVASALVTMRRRTLWAIQLWLAVLIFVCYALRELVRVIGRERIVRIFFGQPSPGVSGSTTR
jgi:hypothetical protein